jgi:hypothetical protein
MRMRMRMRMQMRMGWDGIGWDGIGWDGKAEEERGRVLRSEGAVAVRPPQGGAATSRTLMAPV